MLTWAVGQLNGVYPSLPPYFAFVYYAVGPGTYWDTKTIQEYSILEPGRVSLNHHGLGGGGEVGEGGYQTHSTGLQAPAFPPRRLRRRAPAAVKASFPLATNTTKLLHADSNVVQDVIKT